MSELRKWEFPFPQGKELQERLKAKREEYYGRVNAKLREDGENRDLISKFHADETGDFRRLYLEYLLLSSVLYVQKKSEKDGKDTSSIHTYQIFSESSSQLRIAEYKKDLDFASEVIHEYLLGIKTITLDSDPQPAVVEAEATTAS